jgi:hypothetical protein
MLLRLLLVLVLGFTAFVLVGDEIGLGKLPAPLSAMPIPMVLFVALGALIFVVVALSGRAQRL